MTARTSFCLSKLQKAAMLDMKASLFDLAVNPKLEVLVFHGVFRSNRTILDFHTSLDPHVNDMQSIDVVIFFSGRWGRYRGDSEWVLLLHWTQYSAYRPWMRHAVHHREMNKSIGESWSLVEEIARLMRLFDFLTREGNLNGFLI